MLTKLAKINAMKSENFSKFHKPEKKMVITLLLATLVEVIAFGIACPLHSVFSHMGPLLQNVVDVAGENSEPTVGRLVFGIVTFILGLGLPFLANYFNKKDKELLGFGLAFLSGVLLWQSIGECFWHFQIGGVQIVRIESIQSLPFVIVFVILLIVSGFFSNKNFALWVCVLSFACNWLGHYITLGLYPIVSSGVDWKVWCYTMSGVVGGLATIGGVILSLFCPKTKKGVYLASMLLFIGLGVIYFGFTEA